MLVINQSTRFLILLFTVFITSSLVLFYKKTGCNFCKHSQINMDEITKKENIMPVVILGSGSAGMSAGIYASRLGFKTLIIEGERPGGQLTGTTYVENWPSIQRIMGPKLMEDLKEQNQKLGVSFLQDTVVSVDLSKWPFEVVTADGLKINALTVIVATGSNPRVLGIPGEKEYWGKGVTTCAVCDAPFFKNKNVVVIGGGDSAAEEVLQLAPYVNKITMLVRGNTLRASQAMINHLKDVKSLAILYNQDLKKIMGDDSHVTSIALWDNKQNKEINMDIDGVFLAIGHEPNTQIFKDKLKMDKMGYLELEDRSQKTSVEAVFAAGDVEDHVYKQAGVASGSGIKAALDASRFLQKIGFSPEMANKIQNNYFEINEIGPSKVISINSLDEYKKEVIESEAPVVLDFWANHCPTCKQMLPSFESLSKKFSGKMKFIKVDIDKAPELVKELYILKVPSFIVFKEGQIVARYNDVMQKQQMESFFGQFID